MSDHPRFETAPPWLAVEPERERRQGSLLLPDDRRDGSVRRGRVVAVWRPNDRMRRPAPVCVGDRVLYRTDGVEDVRLESGIVELIPEDALLMVEAADDTADGAAADQRASTTRSTSP